MSLASARASPTRCCMPPESWPGSASARSPRPTCSSAHSAFSRRVRASTPRICSPYSAFCATVRCGSSAKCWNTIAIRSLRRVRRSAAPREPRSRPSTVMLPEVGSMSRFSSRTRVDLPDPDRPMITNSSPSAMSKDTSCTASVAPVRRWISDRPRPSPASRTASSAARPSPKTLVRFRTSIMLPLPPTGGRGPGARPRSPAPPPPRPRCPHRPAGASARHRPAGARTGAASPRTRG